jgi:O-antigen/teichoic acid export membrane protein
MFSFYMWRGRYPFESNYPVRSLLAFSLPLFASAIITLIQGWGDIALLQAILRQFGTTGAYYIVISGATFLSILWAPTAGALYPALSSSYAGDGPQAVRDKLAMAMRLVNLTVLPTGVALAAVAPTILDVIYGSSLRNQAVPFAILAATAIFSAQGLLLITTLQAIGKTTQILGISLAASVVDLAAVGLGAPTLGTTAGAIGRALLAITMMLLALFSVRKVLRAPITQGMSKAIVLSVFSGGSLVLVDNFLTFNFRWPPLLRAPSLLVVFAICFLTMSRALSIFKEQDFYLLKNAMPRFLWPLLSIFQRILVQTTDQISPTRDSAESDP